jgi:hypothetical protein
MQAIEILDTVFASGGILWLEGDKVRARLPESLRPLVSMIGERKPEIVEILEQRPVMPAGIRLLSYQPKEPPVELGNGETVIDSKRFVQSTLRQIEARLHGKNWLAGNLPLSGLVERLAAVGCVIELADRKAMLQ